MQKKIIFKDEKVNCHFKKSKKARLMRLSVGGDAVLTVTVPRFVSFRRAEKFLVEKQSWILKKINLVKNEKICLDKGMIGLSYETCRVKAQALTENRVEYFSKKYGVEYNRIVIKNHKKIWGSCSGKKNLNFNYRIIFLPPELADYIVAHEICHLLEMNHSRNFWSLVEKEISNYKEKRKELKKFSFI